MRTAANLHGAKRSQTENAGCVDAISADHAAGSLEPGIMECTHASPSGPTRPADNARFARLAIPHCGGQKTEDRGRRTEDGANGAIANAWHSTPHGRDFSSFIFQCSVFTWLDPMNDEQ